MSRFTNGHNLSQSSKFSSVSSASVARLIFSLYITDNLHLAIIDLLLEYFAAFARRMPKIKHFVYICHSGTPHRQNFFFSLICLCTSSFIFMYLNMKSNFTFFVDLLTNTRPVTCDSFTGNLHLTREFIFFAI